MKVALFVPCYVDVGSPEVAMATLGLLEKGWQDAAPPRRGRGDARLATTLFVTVIS